MSFMKVLKRIDSDFDELYSPRFHDRVEIPNTAMILVFNFGWHDHEDEPYKLRLEWYPYQDKHCMLIDLFGGNEFIYNSWNLNVTNAGWRWNPNFFIEFDIERGFFDCLPMAYPMTTNFKFEHLAVLKRISDKYAEKKIIHNLK